MKGGLFALGKIKEMPSDDRRRGIPFPLKTTSANLTTVDSRVFSVDRSNILELHMLFSSQCSEVVFDPITRTSTLWLVSDNMTRHRRVFVNRFPVIGNSQTV